MSFTFVTFLFSARKIIIQKRITRYPAILLSLSYNQQQHVGYLLAFCSKNIDIQL